MALSGGLEVPQKNQKPKPQTPYLNLIVTEKMKFL